MRTTPALLAALLLTAPAAGQADLLARARAALKPIPARPPALAGNPASAARVELGRMLFFDRRLSASQLISCNGCHDLGLGGADLQETSVGHGWQRGPRNAPTVLNAVFNVAQFWDGRAADLAAQAKGPLQASVEMSNSPERIVETLRSIPGYAPLFRAAFPGVADPITFDAVARALELFEATLLTPGAPVDRFLAGDRAALGPTERAGLSVFLDKGCVSCHDGVNVGGGGYFPFGVVEAPPDAIRPPGDTGRFQVTHSTDDRYVFRAPSLRNVALTGPYFHSGRVRSLEEAVRIMGSSQLGVALGPEEVTQVTAFLGALTGRQPRIEYPILPAGSGATPPPQLEVPPARPAP